MYRESPTLRQIILTGSLSDCDIVCFGNTGHHVESIVSPVVVDRQK